MVKILLYDRIADVLFCTSPFSHPRAQIIENLRHIPFVPSVQMQEVPRDYSSSDDEDEDVDFDTRITRKLHVSPGLFVATNRTYTDLSYLFTS